jgi:ammonium transporter, Amt family
VLSVLMQCFAITGLMTVLWVDLRLQPGFRPQGMEAGVNLSSFIGGLDKMFLAGVTVDSLTPAPSRKRCS